MFFRCFFLQGFSRRRLLLIQPRGSNAGHVQSSIERYRAARSTVIFRASSTWSSVWFPVCKFVAETDLCILYSWMWLSGDPPLSPDQNKISSSHLWSGDEERRAEAVPSDCLRIKKEVRCTCYPCIVLLEQRRTVRPLPRPPRPWCLLYFDSYVLERSNIFLEWNLNFMQIVDLFSLIISNKCKKKRVRYLDLLWVYCCNSEHVIRYKPDFTFLAKIQQKSSTYKLHTAGCITCIYFKKPLTKPTDQNSSLFKADALNE